MGWLDALFRRPGASPPDLAPLPEAQPVPSGRSSAFDDAVRFVLGIEGGESDDPRDLGGLTKYGISQRAYPHVDIRALTADDAKDIYYRDYWLPVHGDDLPRGVALALFDMAVNSGVDGAVKTAQRSLGLPVDGVIGPNTLAALSSMSREQLALMLADRIVRISRGPGWQTYARGWSKRILLLAMEA